MRAIVVATALVVVVTASGCDGSPAEAPSASPRAATPTASVNASTPAAPPASPNASPMVSKSASSPAQGPDPSPTPTEQQPPVGSGTVTLDGNLGDARGDCVVSTPTVAAGVLPAEAQVDLAVTAVVGQPPDAVSLQVTSGDDIRVRVDGEATADGATAWAASQVAAGLVDPDADGRAVLVLTTPLQPTTPPPTYPVEPVTSTVTPAASPTPAASAEPTPAATTPAPTRPDPVVGAVPDGAADRLLDLAIQCRVTTDTP